MITVITIIIIITAIIIMIFQTQKKKHWRNARYEVTWVTSHGTGKYIIHCHGLAVQTVRGHREGVSWCQNIQIKMWARGGSEGRTGLATGPAEARAQVSASLSKQEPSPRSQSLLAARQLCACPGSEAAGYTARSQAASWGPAGFVCLFSRLAWSCWTVVELERARCWAPLKWRDTSIRTGAHTTGRPRSVHITGETSAWSPLSIRRISD